MLITEKKKYTVADYDMLEEGAPFQLINYDLIMSPSPVSQHQIILGRIFLKFSEYLDQFQNTGTVIFAPIDVQFDEGNVFQPDLIFISAQNSHIIRERINGSPDLIIEILSPSNAYYDLRQKKDVYEQSGLQEYIIIDPMAQSAEAYHLQDGVYQLSQKVKAQGVLNSQTLQGFQLDLSSLFR